MYNAADTLVYDNLFGGAIMLALKGENMVQTVIIFSLGFNCLSLFIQWGLQALFFLFLFPIINPFEIWVLLSCFLQDH